MISLTDWRNLNLKLNSLKLQVTLWFGSLVATVLLVFSLALYWSFSQSFLNREQNHLNNLAVQIYQNSVLNQGKIKLPTNVKYSIVKNAKFLSGNNLNMPKDKDFFVKDNGETLTLYFRYKFFKPQKGEIIIVKSKVDDEIENLTDTLLFLDPVLLLLLLFVAYRATNKMLHPIKLIAQTAKNISVSNFPSPLPKPKYSGEIEELSSAFNTMVSRLQEEIAHIERFNSDIAHELKTPLTVINGEIDLALRGDKDKNSLKQSLTILQKQSKQLEKLVQNLLILNRYKQRDLRKKFNPTQLEEIVLEILEEKQSIIKKRHLKVLVNSLEPITINANTPLIKVLFANLIDNAIKYTPANKKIEIELFKDKNIHFIVKDEGIGIEESKLNKITKRFYRADEARSKKIEGFGLGLSIAKDIAKLHNAKLQFSSKVNIGTIAEVIF